MTEDPVPGYTPTVTGYNVTNVYNGPATLTLPVEKTVTGPVPTDQSYTFKFTLTGGNSGSTPSGGSSDVPGGGSSDIPGSGGNTPGEAGGE